jgi:protein-S-isoprenylcysteine O-methyltransferase Ste14
MKNFNQKHLIHTVLGMSYIFFMIFFVIGIVLDSFYPISLNVLYLDYLGLFLVFFATGLAFWAQHTSFKTSLQRLNNKENNPNVFMCGPYKYICCPTQLSIFLLLFGFGLSANLIWVSITAFISFILDYILFVKKERKILTNRYGESYKMYKAKVHF